MRAFFRTLANWCLAGFLFLLPVFVVFQVVNRGWATLGSLAGRIARLLGARHVLGQQAETVFTGLLLIFLCILCGWLVRFSLVSAFHDAIERQLAKYIPGYEAYKATAEGKVHTPVKVRPYTSALIMHSGFWRPGYVIERDGAGNSVVFLPRLPNTDEGDVLLAAADRVKVLPSVTADQLDAALKNMGKGLLSKYQVVLSGQGLTMNDERVESRRA